jgi:hypothetical protein
LARKVGTAARKFTTGSELPRRLQRASGSNCR